MVDSNDVAHLGGLSSAFSPSLPASWSDVESGGLFYGIAPELIDPSAFGFVQARPTEATDVFAFGMLAWEVSPLVFSRSRGIHLLVSTLAPRWEASVRWQGRSRCNLFRVPQRPTVATCPS